MAKFNLPPPQAPFVQAGSGVLSNEGYQFFIDLFNFINKQIPTASLAATVSAAGVNQATAFQLASQWNVVSTASATANGVLLASYKAGQIQVVFNVSGATISVYPPPGLQIDSLGNNVAYSLNNNKMQIFNFVSTSQIDSTQLG